MESNTTWSLPRMATIRWQTTNVPYPQLAGMWWQAAPTRRWRKPCSMDRWNQETDNKWAICWRNRIKKIWKMSLNCLRLAKWNLSSRNGIRWQKLPMLSAAWKRGCSGQDRYHNVGRNRIMENIQIKLAALWTCLMLVEPRWAFSCNQSRFSFSTITGTSYKDLTRTEEGWKNLILPLLHQNQSSKRP